MVKHMIRVAKLSVSSMAIAALSFVYVACSDDSSARTCTVNADCASGQCMADGKCAPVGGATDGGSDDSATGGDDAKPPSDGGGSDSPIVPGDSGLCTANGDGIITREEVPLRAGLKGTFKATTSGVKVDTAGTSADAGGADAGGPRNWDFSGALTGDHTLVLETLPLTGQWFEADYPGATYYARLSDSSDLLGVFAVTSGALELRGVVSPQSGSGQTKITYDPTVPTLAFPLQKGKEWEVEATASGDIPVTFNVAYTERYTFKVDAEGELRTSTSLNPFKVMRVSVLVKRTPSFSFVSYYTRQYVYVAECFGAVAKVVGEMDQTSVPDEDFTDASEIQRLAP
jgi:hypothetical protein